jgi:hypothetical protein
MDTFSTGQRKGKETSQVFTNISMSTALSTGLVFRTLFLNPEMEACDTLFKGFWLQRRQSLEVRGMQAYGSISGEDFRREEHYIGPRSQHPKPMYRIEQDCHA